MTLVKHASPFLFATIALGAAGGCSEATECVETSADDVATPRVEPALVHTGTDGVHVFRAVITSNFGGVEWTSDDNDVVSVQRIGCVNQDNDVQTATAVLTARNAGETTVTGVSGGFTQAVNVIVTSYTPEDYDAGLARYNTPADSPDERRACADCHFGDAATAVPHTPLEMAEYTDEELLAVTLTGVEPDRCLQPTRARCDCVPDGTDPATACAACPEADCALTLGRTLALGAFDDRGHGDHAWDLTPEEEAGIIAFMRGIAPSGF